MNLLFQPVEPMEPMNWCIDYTILDWTLEIVPFANRPYGRFLEKSNKIELR